MTDFRALCQELMDAIDSGIPVERIKQSPLAVRVDAALRAAADQTVPLHICGTNATRAQTRLGIRHKLLAIAAELEGAGA